LTTTKTFADKTSADDTSIGFEYQYYYFLNAVLNLKVGQSAGLEVKDDVHTELNQDYNILYQLKHTVQTSSLGSPKALTQLDADLWKTLANWSKVITDTAAGRKDVLDQVNFVQKTEFHLVSNKSLSLKNSFLTTIQNYRTGKIDFEEVNRAIADLKAQATGVTTLGYIHDIQSLDSRIARIFFARIHIELELDDIIAKVKQSILEKAVDPARVDDTFKRLDSSIREDNFVTVKAGKAIIISFEDFMKRYRKIFEDSRSKTLQYTNFKLDLPTDVFAQPFIQELIKIEDISPGEDELAIEYTRHKLRFSRHIRQWIQNGDLVSDDVQALHVEVITRWRQEHRNAYKACSSEKIIAAAQEVLRIMRREKYSLGATELDTQMSNGELYDLSDRSQIGWHKEWKK